MLEILHGLHLTWLISRGDGAFLHLRVSLVFIARASGLRGRDTTKNVALDLNRLHLHPGSSICHLGESLFSYLYGEVTMVIMTTHNMAAGTNNLCEGNLYLETLYNRPLLFTESVRAQTEALFPGSWLFHWNLHDLEPLQTSASSSVK